MGKGNGGSEQAACVSRDDGVERVSEDLDRIGNSSDLGGPHRELFLYIMTRWVSLQVSTSTGCHITAADA